MVAAKLIGKKITLGPVLKKDLKLFHKWVNDVDVTKYLTINPLILTIQDEEEFFDNNRKNPNTKWFSINIKKTCKVIGSCELKEIDPVNRTATLGIMIGDKTSWNKGYGTEAVDLLVNFGFDTLNLNNIMLTVFAFNERAYFVYQKIGFKEMGKRRHARYFNGKYHDEIYMDITKDEKVKI